MPKKAKSIPFGERLRHLREAAGLSVAELAQRAGMQRTHVHAIEGGRKRQVLFDTATRLAAALGVAVEKFYS
jgi:transcriptional regulator with XRE-family HTH domain